MARGGHILSTAGAIPSSAVPDSILIIGAGVFGLSTLSHLLARPTYASTRIILLDTHLPSLDPTPEDTSRPTQNPHAASIDSSRIVRPDYANAAYARLAIAAQREWRRGYGECASCESGHGKKLKKGNGGRVCLIEGCDHSPVYNESGVILTAGKSGSEYVRKAHQNAQELGLDVTALEGSEAIAELLEKESGPTSTKRRAGYGPASELHGRKEKTFQGGSNIRGTALGETGYVNHSSGWVDNGRAMANLMAEVVETARVRNQHPSHGKITFVRGKANHLLFSSTSSNKPKATIIGVAVQSSPSLHATLTILATGAHTPSLLDLRSHAEARAQAMAYLPVSPSEASALQTSPVLLNMTTGMFVIPPVLTPLSSSSNPNAPPEKKHMIKIARHAYGYANPTPVTLPIPTTTPSTPKQTIHPSLPAPHYTSIPPDALTACRSFLQATYPQFAHRPFSSTRLCWYTDTPRGDFLVDWVPRFEGLFVATGGSGHAFKFLPVLGEKVVGIVEGDRESEVAGLWKWKETDGVWTGGTEDGSRSGDRGAVLGEEWNVAVGVGEKSRL